jgi:serine/threonine protein kinase
VEAEEEAAKQRQELRSAIDIVYSGGAAVALSFDLVHGWTDGFKEELDRGAFGIVYKGLVTLTASAAADVAAADGGGGGGRRSAGTGDGRYVAVKVFNTDSLAVCVTAMTETGGDDDVVDHSSNSVLQSVSREINILSSFHHPNIIRLVG